MFRIGICEDELTQQEYMEKSIMAWADKKQNRIQISKFISAEQFLFEYEDFEDFDLLILDIQLSNMTGMELAKEIRRKDNTVKIVFLTGDKDYAIEGYEVGAVRYLMKPLKIDLLEEVLDIVWENLQQNPAMSFVYTKGGQTFKVPYMQIMYVEADGHYCRLITRQETHEWKSKFSELVSFFIPQGFCALKRGLLVNLRYVNQITKTDCILENGEKLPIAKSCYDEVNRMFISFYRENAW